MSSGFVMSAMSVSEFVLWITLALLFWKKRLTRRFPAMGAYLALHVASTPILLAVLYAQSRPWGHAYFSIYFFSYWTIYIVSAVLLFFICFEVFRSALSAFPGLMRIGVALFRWAVLISLIVTFFSISFVHFGVNIIPEIADGLMRAVGVLTLCLLAFLCLGMNALRLSARDAAFGIALGFGLMSANDFTFASLVSAHVSLTAPLQFAYEALVLVALFIWTVYCALPEPARKPVVMPASSTIYRWNEIASALGHTGTQVAVQQPANGFFLTDVEKVVEKVLNRNLNGRESEL
jgi:hypothetical protein